MKLVLRVVRGLSLAVGMLIVGSLLLALIALPLRYLQVEMVGHPVDTEHLTGKEHYLNTVHPPKNKTPNIVVIFFDDLGFGDLSSYGNQLIKTPNIDRVASEGLLMTNFYSASPVCTPSRAALLTGRFPARTRTDKHVFFNDDSLIGVARRIFGLANALPKEEITFPEIMNKAGYRTGMIGKWHLGSSEGYRPNDFGFDEWFGVLYSNDMYPLDLYQNGDVIIKDEREGSFFSGEWDEQNPLPGKGIDQTELTNMYTEEAIKFLQNAGDNPFLMYLAHSLPHVPHYASKEFANSSAGGNYGDVVEDLDRSTGAIMEALDRLELSEETIVIITSDNGADHNGSAGDLRGRKQEIYEGGQRVPMIVRWPGKISAGTVSDQMAMNTDLFPTLLALLELEHPADRVIDGKDISALWQKGAKSPHDYLYYFPTIDAAPCASPPQGRV